MMVRFEGVGAAQHAAHHLAHGLAVGGAAESLRFSGGRRAFRVGRRDDHRGTR